MSIVKMQRLRLIALAQDRDALLDRLLHAGCVELSEPTSYLADEDWANWRKQSGYTLEQQVRIVEKIKSGELIIPKEVRKALEEEEKAQAELPPRSVHPEVEAWPEMADNFLKKYFRGN